MKAAILYNKFFDHDGTNRLIGGVETYLLNLAGLCRELNLETTIYQWSNAPFIKNFDGVEIRGVPVNHLALGKRNKALFQEASKDLDKQRDIIIFGADHVSVPTDSPRHISIQHGVSWDLPVEYMTDRVIVKYEWAAKLKKWRSITQYRQCFENCKNTVCVDYNFLNWYRTTITREIEGHHIWIIPNFSQVASEEQITRRKYDNEVVRILFARRFERIRGTRLIADTANCLLGRNNKVRFTFAGEGPEEEWLQERFASEERVCFQRYTPDKALDIHLRHDIAVIPSLASEGTSLSVAEAMAAGCSVVASAVGGITNMIIDMYNGILVMPDSNSFLNALDYLISCPELRQSISSRAYHTAKESFSLERWKQSWQSVLTQVMNG